ncbi:MAG: glycosyltransferase family 2 protein [Lachnospiraceae bacterium]|nr:glycosyltransferase family 2 protein [Lachnospiraceae bacterium]
MEKEIGIVICNYNKQDYVLKCLESLFASDTDDFDVYVVDNASQDDSVKQIKEQFGDRVTLLVNQENLGGSGGFNTGLRKVLEGDYKYLMCVDNDIVFAPDAVSALRRFLEEHEDTAVVGSKAYFMDEPDKIWNFGGIIRFDTFIQQDQHKNCVDAGQLPEVVYGDYVPACSLMARVDAVRKVGIMPEDNFIYWDDMEWGYRFRQAGYRVASCGKSKVWHKAGGRNAGNTFIHYYMWRNRIHFFRQFLPPEDRERFAESLLTEMFRMIYSVNLKGETNIIRTLMYAFDDAVHGVRGKAKEGRILPRPAVANRLEQALSGKESVLIRFNGSFEGIGNIVKNIRKALPDMRIAISAADCPEQAKELTTQYPDCEVTERYEPERFAAHLVMCEHIFKLSPDMEKDSYIDPWCNLIYTAKDFIYASSFEQTKELFVLCKKELLCGD